MYLLIVSPTLGNAASLIFGYAAAANLVDHQGSITLGGGWVFLLLGSDGCCIVLSYLGGGLVLLRNGGTGWGILAVSFTLHSVINSLLVSRLGGSASVRI